MAFSRVDAGAIFVGTCVTVVLSATMVIAGLKAGITPGVSPLVVICCWGCLQRVVHSPDGVRFLNLAQVAGSSSMAIVSGVIFSEPLLQVLHLNQAADALQNMGVAGDIKKMPWDDAKVLLADNGFSIPGVAIGDTLLGCFAGSLLGLGVVGLATKRFLSDNSLPAPEAQACKTLVMTATNAGAQRPNLSVSLALSSLMGLVSPLLCHMSLTLENVVLAARAASVHGASFELALPFSPVYLGIGGLLTLSCALAMFSGAVLRLVGEFCLASAGASEAWPANSMRWVGGGMMTVAVIYSMARFMSPWGSRRSETSEVDGDLLELSRRQTLTQSAAVLAGSALLAVWLFGTDGLNGFSVAIFATLMLMALMMTMLGALLSLQVGSSASPVSGTVFITTLVLCLVSLACDRRTIQDVPILTTLLVAACVSVCSANDTSQDYKTLQLCGLAPREGFLAQAVGLLSGSLVVPFSLYIANNAYGIGTDRLVAPQGQMFAVLIDGLLLSSSIPWGPVGVGLALGVVAVSFEFAASRFGMQIPAMAMSIGLYLPAEMGVGVLLGSLCRFAGEHVRRQRVGKSERTHEGILAAAGLITGSAFMDLVLGIATLFGFNISSMSLFSSDGEEGKAPIPQAIRICLTFWGITCLAGVLYYNSFSGVAEADADAPADDKKAAVEVEAPNPSGKSGKLGNEVMADVEA